MSEIYTCPKCYYYAAKLLGAVAPDVEPLDNLFGVISQLDNWSVGILAEVEQWQRIIVTHVDVIAEKDAHIKELEGYLNKPPGERLVCDDCFYPSKVKELQADIGLLHRKMTSPRITEMEAQIEVLQAEANRNMEELCRARADALVMALRLLGEDDNSFGPECHEVMKRWGEIAEAALQGGRKC